ncbi:TPA: TetR/AcrR family transcriptional regulator, partial [Klebsiella quasipneumoniae subsp. similipneumoniae]|nr:TetR/AcrR family transcriptional regulator [Klebsiella quasipneumoniae subsp. similipneumoniae]
SYAALARFLGLGWAADAAGEGDWEQLKRHLGMMCLSYLVTPVEAG